jgi:hypothetical protein
MINAIGESTVHQAIRVQQSAAVVEREEEVQKTMQASVPRPVERADDSQHSDMNQNDEKKSETTSRQRIEDGQVVIEKYDRQGKLVKKTPPGYIPFGEMA